ncbi:MAG: geranylgeranyl reductase family protein [Actinomycetota bacterium]|nr:geranylgeranyl reductase family protein [Actinomycetota bacterium]
MTATRPAPERVEYADVAIVGAGPGGSTAAAHLASAGRAVAVVEKEAFPREKVCGDGLTPRAVKQLHALGLPDEAEGRVEGWRRIRGLRIHGGGATHELPWPPLEDWPAHGLTCNRLDFDATLARHAAKAGAVLWERTEVVGPLWREDAAGDGDGRVVGVRWRDAEGREGEIRAPVVIASDGASSRFATGLGLHRDADRPIGVAVRTYFRSPMHEDTWLSSFLDLKEGEDLLPGYGWVFPMADATINLGCGLLNTSQAQGINYRRLMDRWAAAMPPEWQVSLETRTGSLRSGALPMGFSRTPHHRGGVLLVGDAGGMVNPFNGEGIAYAMEAAQLAAEVIDSALARRSTAVLDHYPAELRRRWGGYYTLGRLFVHLIGHPEVMRICTTYGMPRRRLMLFVLKLLANLTDRRPGDATDLVINSLSRLAPAS